MLLFPIERQFNAVSVVNPLSSSILLLKRLQSRKICASIHRVSNHSMQKLAEPQVGELKQSIQTFDDNNIVE
jgi:hypothetical protein